MATKTVKAIKTVAIKTVMDCILNPNNIDSPYHSSLTPGAEITLAVGTDFQCLSNYRDQKYQFFYHIFDNPFLKNHFLPNESSNNIDLSLAKIVRGIFVQLIGTFDADSVGVVAKLRITQDDGTKHFLSFPKYLIMPDETNSWHEISFKTTFDTSGTPFK